MSILPLFVSFAVYSFAAGVPQTHSFATLAKGSQSGVRERRLVAVKSEPEWVRLWTDHVSTATPRKEPPAVNFQTEMIVAVFSGQKRSGGYGIEITRIQENPTKNVLEVVVRETKPPPGAFTTQALSHPFHIVKLNRIELPVNFVFAA